MQNPITGDEHIVDKRKAEQDAEEPAAKRQALEKSADPPGVTFSPTKMDQFNDSDFEGFDSDDDETAMPTPLSKDSALGIPASASLMQTDCKTPAANAIAAQAPPVVVAMDSDDEFAAWEDEVLAEAPIPAQAAGVAPQINNKKKKKDVEITAIDASDPSRLTSVDLKKFNVDSLKAHLKTLKTNDGKPLKMAGKKEVLIDRILEHHKVAALAAI